MPEEIPFIAVQPVIPDDPRRYRQSPLGLFEPVLPIYRIKRSSENTAVHPEAD
jgi:hypothetical protein